MAESNTQAEKKINKDLIGFPHPMKTGDSTQVIWCQGWGALLNIYCMLDAVLPVPHVSLLAFLLPLPVDVKLLLVAPDICCAFPLEFVPFNFQRVIDGDLVTL